MTETRGKQALERGVRGLKGFGVICTGVAIDIAISTVGNLTDGHMLMVYAKKARTRTEYKITNTHLRVAGPTIGQPSNR